MSERPRHLTHVVHRRQSGGNRRPPRGPSARTWLGGLLFAAALGVAALILVQVLAAPAATPLPNTAPAPAAAAGTPGPADAATPTPEPPDATSTFLAPSPTPTRVNANAPTVRYLAQTGDSLLALAARFGVNPDDIRRPAGFHTATTLDPGQPFIIPNVLDPAGLGPNQKLAPDSEVVFSAAAAGFDAAAFARQRGGYLAGYHGFAEGQTQAGGDVVLTVARQHSVNPRLLLVLLEQLSGWVTDPAPAGRALTHPLGFAQDFPEILTPQLGWAANQLAIGYYGWRAGTLTALTFPDKTSLRLDPTLNAGTVAVQYYLAQLYSRPQWDDALAAFTATYQNLFGDPFAHELPTLIPGDLAQPPLRFPFLSGVTWYFSGGPHGAWENGGAQAALDFAPGALESGCASSEAWVAAAAAGQVIRSDHNAVVLDLDGDGRETTGWVLFYFHIADKGRIKAGVYVEPGDRLGHPSCEGGRATGTHVHLARKYNGEWILAAGAIPFDLEGWVVHAGAGEYLGTLEREGEVVKACTCTAAWTAVTAGR